MIFIFKFLKLVIQVVFCGVSASQVSVSFFVAWMWVKVVLAFCGMSVSQVSLSFFVAWMGVKLVLDFFVCWKLFCGMSASRVSISFSSFAEDVNVALVSVFQTFNEPSHCSQDPEADGGGDCGHALTLPWDPSFWNAHPHHPEPQFPWDLAVATITDPWCSCTAPPSSTQHGHHPLQPSSFPFSPHRCKMYFQQVSPVGSQEKMCFLCVFFVDSSWWQTGFIPHEAIIFTLVAKTSFFTSWLFIHVLLLIGMDLVFPLVFVSVPPPPPPFFFFSSVLVFPLVCFSVPPPFFFSLLFFTSSLSVSLLLVLISR